MDQGGEKADKNRNIPKKKGESTRDPDGSKKRQREEEEKRRQQEERDNDYFWSPPEWLIDVKNYLDTHPWIPIPGLPGVPVSGY
jgi:hypothetical protein